MHVPAVAQGFVQCIDWPRLKWRTVGLLPRPFRFEVQDWLTDHCFQRALRNRAEGTSWREVTDRWDYESYEIWDARCQFHSEQLITRANRLMVKIPSRVGNEDDENWTRSTFDGEWYLTLDGIERVRALVREEERLQREDRKSRYETSRLVLVSGVIAAVGSQALPVIKYVIALWKV